MNPSPMSLRDFDPLVAEWFQQRFDAATEPQTQGWPEIRSGRDVLISAPTGSGKTLAAFLICLDDLIRSARAGALSDQTVAVYVSPLKALSNDIHKKPRSPLGGNLRNWPRKRGWSCPGFARRSAPATPRLGSGSGCSRSRRISWSRLPSRCSSC